MNYKPDFKENDIIEFCNEEFIVLENHGCSGTVKERHGRTVVSNFHWEYAGERCRPLPKAIDSTEHAQAAKEV